MCGIAGIVKTSESNYSIESELLRKMSDIIEHRGPDSDGQWIDKSGKVGFAFRRLAIIDLSANGNQPMFSQNGKYAIVFNGEIYNHNELRNELIKKGYKYNSNTDTETIMYGYQEWGEQILTKMYGMWAFVLYDIEKQEIFASRDRIGIKPFYYLLHNSNFIFGSEIKSILQYPQYQKQLNYEQLAFYLNMGSSNSEATMFDGINKLPAAHYLKISTNGEIKVKRYWDPFATRISYNDWSENELTSEIINLLRDAIKIRMMSDVPFGVFLSGGIDSSLNVSLMSEFMNRPIDTFTVGFKDLEKYNELEYAHKISNLFKTNHKEIIIDQKMALDELDKVVWHSDEPNADPVNIPIYFLSKKTRQEGTIVVLVGEGSDEQFIGYNWMLREIKFHQKYWNLYNVLPISMRKLIYHILKNPLMNSNQFLALEYFKKSANNWEQYWSGMPIFTTDSLNKLFFAQRKSEINNLAEYANKMNDLAESYDVGVDFSRKAIFTEFHQRLPEMLLMRVDKMGMANSIEPRVPFLDHRLVELTFALNYQKKIPDGKTTKHLLKKASVGYIPDEIINRKKQGFAAPVNEWINNEWFEFTKSTILQSQLIKENILDAEFIKKMLALHKSKKANFYKEIYALLMLSLWYEKYFN